MRVLIVRIGAMGDVLHAMPAVAALRRTDVVVLREEEREGIEARIRSLMRAGAAICTVRRTVEVPEAADGLHSVGGAVAFCGIARPEGFVETLRTGGARVVDSIAFPDHHRYVAEDMHRLTESMRVRGGTAFITTEKDAVKLTPELRVQLEAPVQLSPQANWPGSTSMQLPPSGQSAEVVQAALQ